jgi:hypothetical protein
LSAEISEYMYSCCSSYMVAAHAYLCLSVVACCLLDVQYKLVCHYWLL